MRDFLGTIRSGIRRHLRAIVREIDLGKPMVKSKGLERSGLAMNTRIISRITGAGILVLAVAVVVTVIKTSGWNSANLVPTASGLIVHEWGTFTSIAGKDGVTLEWRPLNGA